MKEQFQIKIDSLQDKKLLILGLAILVVLALFIEFESGSSTETVDKARLSVGENAWGDVVEINISDRPSPSTASLETSDTLIWRNRNNFSVTISIENVKRSFNVSSGEKQIFKPSSGFEYEVTSEKGFIGSGEVVVG